MSLPRMIGRLPLCPAKASLAASSLKLTVCAVGVGQLDAHHASCPGSARRAREIALMLRAMSSARPITRLALMPGRGLELVHRHHRAGAHRGDLALDVEVVEHVLEQARVALERELVELGAVRPAGLEQVEARQLVAVTQIETGLNRSRSWPLSDRGHLALGHGNDGRRTIVHFDRLALHGWLRRLRRPHRSRVVEIRLAAPEQPVALDLVELQADRPQDKAPDRGDADKRGCRPPMDRWVRNSAEPELKQLRTEKARRAAKPARQA